MSGPGQQGNCKNSIAERVTTGNYSVSKNVLWAVDFVMSLQRWVPIVSLWFPRYIINTVYCDGGLQRMLICLFVCFCILSHSISIVLKTTSSLLFSFSWRYGRILIYLISCFGVGVTGVVVAFAPNFSVFVIFRFLQGVFGKGAWMTCFVIGKNCFCCNHSSVWELEGAGLGGGGSLAQHSHNEIPETSLQHVLKQVEDLGWDSSCCRDWGLF